jgi:hypothetical protein
VEFHPNNFDCCFPGYFHIGYFGAKSNSGGKRYWGVQFDTSVQSGGAAVVVAQATLLVGHLRWHATSFDVDLYVNPAPASLGGAAPASPTFTAHAATRYWFWNISLHTDGAGAGSFDELRLGTDYAAVTPTGTPVSVRSTAPLSAPSVEAFDGLLARGMVRGNVRVTDLAGRTLWRCTSREAIHLPVSLAGKVVVVSVAEAGRTVVRQTVLR